MSKCACCGYDDISYKCSICGFLNVPVAVNDGGYETAKDKVDNYKRTEEYRENVLSHITDISFFYYEYGFRDNEFKLLQKKEYCMAKTAEECSKGVIISDIDFAKPVKNGSEIKLNVGYRFAGSEKSASFSFESPVSRDFLKIGLCIDNNMNMTACLLSDSEHRESVAALDLSVG